MKPDRHRRGARVLRGWAVRRTRLRLALQRGPQALRLAGVPLSRAEEVRHFKLIGTTGTGKSSAIRELLSGALARGDRAIVSDPDGLYCAVLADRWRGDVILNPFTRGARRWDPFAEYAAPYDAELIANGLIPNTEDPSGREWRGYARTFLTAVLRGCRARGWLDAGELWRLIAIASPIELRTLVANTPAQPFLDPENARMFGSIRAVAASAAAALEHVQTQRARAFSVRAWVRQGPGALFLPYTASQIPALRTIIATWLRLAIFEALTGAESDRRLWFVVDELDALGAIDGLKDALVRLRKFGGRCVLGFQSVAQVSTTYGAGEANTIIENCANTLILRCSSSEQGGTSQFASRLIGEREVLRAQRTRGRDRGGELPWGRARSSMQNSHQCVTESAVLASEIEQLPDMTGYLKTAANRAWLHVRVRPVRGGAAPPGQV